MRMKNHCNLNDAYVNQLVFFLGKICKLVLIIYVTCSMQILAQNVSEMNFMEIAQVNILQMLSEIQKRDRRDFIILFRLILLRIVGTK